MDIRVGERGTVLPQDAFGKVCSEGRWRGGGWKRREWSVDSGVSERQSS